MLNMIHSLFLNELSTKVDICMKTRRLKQIQQTLDGSTIGNTNIKCLVQIKRLMLCKYEAGSVHTSTCRVSIRAQQEIKHTSMS